MDYAPFYSKVSLQAFDLFSKLRPVLQKFLFEANCCQKNATILSSLLFDELQFYLLLENNSPLNARCNIPRSTYRPNIFKMRCH